jgi:hypothetical protein
MSIIQVGHIKNNCHPRFRDVIDMSDIKTTDTSKRDMQLLSRCLAAFAISAAVPSIDDLTAAKSVVDEFQDDGIDAFYFDRDEHVVYLVQSKWISNGSGSVDLGSVLKFIQGINNFLEGKLDRLGPKLQAKATDINEALADSKATFVLILAYTGKPPISPETEKPLTQLLGKLNDGGDEGDMVSLRVLNLKELHSIVETGALGAPVNLTIMLKDFGVVREPYKAYYGQVDVADIHAWGEHGSRLYHKNIRSFKGNTDVNSAIVTTVRDTPDNFFYFNNGITLLCTELFKQPLGGSSTSSGVFDCKGASVINGAQTVGSIVSALSGANSSSSSARVMVKLISLQGCPVDFGQEITRATNTQNKIEKRDFASLDIQQTRLKSELLLSFQKEYVYRTGDQVPDPKDGCTLDEATVALACAQPDISYAMDAKSNIGKLYENIGKPPYTVLFNSSLTAGKLWQAVQVSRIVDAYLKLYQGRTEGKDRLIAIHGNRVMLHLVFRKLGDKIFDETTQQEEMAKIPAFAADLLEKLTHEVTVNHSTSYPGNIFKNSTKCRQIVMAIGAAGGLSGAFGGQHTGVNP